MRLYDDERFARATGRVETARGVGLGDSFNELRAAHPRAITDQEQGIEQQSWWDALTYEDAVLWSVGRDYWNSVRGGAGGPFEMASLGNVYGPDPLASLQVPVYDLDRAVITDFRAGYGFENGC